MFKSLPKKLNVLTFFKTHRIITVFASFNIILVILTVFCFSFIQSHLKNQLASSVQKYNKINNLYEALKKVDQKIRNDILENENKNIRDAYKNTVLAYEDLLELKEKTDSTAEIDINFAKILSLLSQGNYASASAMLSEIKEDIKKVDRQIADSFQIPASVSVNNNPPASGYQQQVVKTDFGEYLVGLVAADLNSTRVIVDTASEGTCTNDCPVDSLASYAGRSGAFAGINGPYFCPAEYPSCSEKKNSFDTLLMNKNKVYFNSDNNVYSTVPTVIFSPGSARFVGQSLEWGRDTGVDSVIASQPMLVSGGNVVFGGDEDVKKSGKGTRSFIGSTGNTVYIGVVYNVNVAKLARILKAMGIENALNLDSGGSTAFWVNGQYIAGPGRNTPFGILLVRR